MTTRIYAPRQAAITSATDKQLAFIDRLLSEKDLSGTPFLDEPRPRYLTKDVASRVIDQLMSLPRQSRAAEPTTDIEGMHKVGHRVFKVQRAVHGSGGLYAKELSERHDHSWSFEYAPGAIKRFGLNGATKMTLAEAKAFGALYGTCCVCGRTLTNETSIEEGIGPVCAGRLA
ncbi:MAG: DUF6011 domain-containing protein [Candidatus Moraniibacteriota bacterium]